MELKDIVDMRIESTVLALETVKEMKNDGIIMDPAIVLDIASAYSQFFSIGTIREDMLMDAEANGFCEHDFKDAGEA